jgi:hypothetical protein
LFVLELKLKLVIIVSREEVDKNMDNEYGMNDNITNSPLETVIENEGDTKGSNYSDI